MSSKSSSITVPSYAKVNLFLEVLARRPDGYHEIETLMQEISLHDTLTFTRIPRGIRLECDDPALPRGRSNLVWQAASLLKRRCRVNGGARIKIEKRIPLGGGLGGGSSNAAATLRALNSLWNLGLRIDEMEFLGAQLGSDVPFFVRGGAAICRGRGEVVIPVRLLERYWYVLVLPGLAVPTRQVYAGIALTLHRRRATLQTGVLCEKTAGERALPLFNRLETPAFRLHPALRRLKKAVAEACPGGALMSGSGSSLFAICRSRKEAQSVKRRLERSVEAKIMAVCGRP